MHYVARGTEAMALSAAAVYLFNGQMERSKLQRKKIQSQS